MSYVIAQQTSDVQNNGSILFSDVCLLTVPDTAPRFFRWSGTLWTNQADKRSQIELALGAGTTYARSNVALPQAGWWPTGGTFLHIPRAPLNDPALIKLRVRSYDTGAGAIARGFVLMGIGFDQLTIPHGYGYTRDNGTGTDTPTTVHVQAGQRVIAQTATLSSVIEGSYWLACSLEYQHNSQEDGMLELYRGDLKLIEEPLRSQGLFNHYASHEFYRLDDSQYASDTYTLIVQAPSDTTLTFRRPTILAMHQSGL